MINALRLKNFQSHEDTKIKFDPGVNVFTGSSDSGKSAILRAINLITNNKPGGSAYISKWSDSCEVQLFTDDHKIERKKTKSKNYYTLDGSEFHAIGSAVPSQICDIMNMNELNFSYQMSSPFMLSETSGEVARKLNKIVNLEKIDKAISHMNRKIRESSSKKEYLAEQLQKERDKLDGFTQLEDLCKVVSELKEESGTCELLEKQSKTVLKIIQDSESIERTVDNLEKRTLLYDDACKFESEYAGIRQHSTNCDSLRLLIGRIEETERNEQLSSSRASLLPQMEQLCQERLNIESLDRDLVNFELAFNSAMKKEEEFKVLKDRLSSMEKEYKELFGEECPLCGKPI